MQQEALNLWTEAKEHCETQERLKAKSLLQLQHALAEAKAAEASLMEADRWMGILQYIITRAGFNIPSSASDIIRRPWPVLVNGGKSCCFARPYITLLHSMPAVHKTVFGDGQSIGVRLD